MLLFKMTPNPSVKARPTAAGTSRKRAAPYLQRWAASAEMITSCSFANGNRVALAHAAAPSAAVLRRPLSHTRQQPARASVSRRRLSACGSMKNTLHSNRSGSLRTARVLKPMLAPAGAFAVGSGRTAVSSFCRGNPRWCRAVFLTPSAVSRRLTFARTLLPVPWQSASPNPAVNRTAGKQGLPVRSALARSAGRLLLR